MYIIMKSNAEGIRSMVKIFDDWKDAQEAMEAMNLSYIERGYGYSENNGYVENEYQIYELHEI